MESNELELAKDLKFRNEEKQPKSARYISCNFCQQKLSVDRLKRHQDFYCPKTITSCPICCLKIQNDLAEVHLEQCLQQNKSKDQNNAEQPNQDPESSWEYGSEYESEEEPFEESKVRMEATEKQRIEAE